jgi:hypothetical protein
MILQFHRLLERHGQIGAIFQPSVRTGAAGAGDAPKHAGSTKNHEPELGPEMSRTKRCFQGYFDIGAHSGVCLAGGLHTR